MHGIRPVIGKAFDLFFLRQDNGHSKNHSKKDIQFREFRELRELYEFRWACEPCEPCDPREPRDPCGLRNHTTEFEGWRFQYESC